MKIVYLFFYLWHYEASGNASAGGPAITIQAMPSRTMCEQVGKHAKQFADKQPHASSDLALFGHNIRYYPSTYECIEVAEETAKDCK